MTENSRFWTGTSTGDASEAPYDAPTEFARVLISLAGAGAIPTNLGGVFRGELNVLAVSGATSPVAVASGRALAYGNWYENDASLNVAVSTPAVSTRIDRVVLRKSWAAQTVRITLIAGVEGGGAPALVQIAGTTWDTPLAQVSITTGGVITLTDEREFIGGQSPLQALATSDVTIASDDSLNSDAQLRIPLAANTSYAFVVFILYNSDATPDFKWGFSVPAACTMLYGVQRITGGVEGVANGLTEASTPAADGTASDFTFRLEGVIQNGANAGECIFQWAQNTSDVANTSRLTGSYFIANRLN